MSEALARRSRKSIRIFRPEMRPGGRVYFQREWEPVFCPEAFPRGEPRPAFDSGCRPDALKMPRISCRYHSALTGVALTVALTAFVSLGMTVKTAGLTLDAITGWLTAWQTAALIAIPARFALAPLVTRFIGLFVEMPSPR